MDYSLPGSSVHGILQAMILEWVAMPASRGSSQPRDQTHISMSLASADRFFTTPTTKEASSELKWPQMEEWTWNWSDNTT